MKSQEDQKQALLDTLYALYREIENNVIYDIQYSVEIGAVKSYSGIVPDNNREWNISYRILPKKINNE